MREADAGKVIKGCFSSVFARSFLQGVMFAFITVLLALDNFRHQEIERKKTFISVVFFYGSEVSKFFYFIPVV